MSRNLEPHRSLTDPYATTAELLGWSDADAEADYSDRVTHLKACLAKVKRTATPQAAYASERLTAELARVQALLAADRSVEKERAAYLAAARGVDDADAAVRVATEAGDVNALLRARAERDIAAHKSRTARAVFIEAALARKLPSLSPEYGPVVEIRAKHETADLACHAGAVAKIDDEPFARQSGDARIAQDVALAHGRAAVSMGRVSPVAAYWAVAEAEYDSPEEADHRSLFAARWFAAAPLLGVERPAPIEWHAPAAE